MYLCIVSGNCNPLHVQALTEEGCLQQLKKQKEKKEQWKRQGHGEYHELQHEKEFFETMKGEESMVCHFYRNNWPCKVMDKHLSALCKQHMECKFAKVRFSSTAS